MHWLNIPKGGIYNGRRWQKGKKQSNAEKPISLKRLKFDEAVSDLLKVKPQR